MERAPFVRICRQVGAWKGVVGQRLRDRLADQRRRLPQLHCGELRADGLPTSLPGCPRSKVLIRDIPGHSWDPVGSRLPSAQRPYGGGGQYWAVPRPDPRFAFRGGGETLAQPGPRNRARETISGTPATTSPRTRLTSLGLVHGVGARRAISDWTPSLNRDTTGATGSVCRRARRSRGSGGTRALTYVLPTRTLPESPGRHHGGGYGRARTCGRTRRAHTCLQNRPEGGFAQRPQPIIFLLIKKPDEPRDRTDVTTRVQTSSLSRECRQRGTVNGWNRVFQGFSRAA